MADARASATEAIIKWERERAYADLLLGEFSDAIPDARDKALFARVFYGVIQNLAYLDYVIARFSAVKPKKMHPRVLAILRVGAYQILFLDRIPVPAAVNESVALARSTGNAKASGLVNAVLRRVAEVRDELPYPEEATPLLSLAKRYSHPENVAEIYLRALGGELRSVEAAFKENNSSPDTCLRLNALKCASWDKVMEKLPEGAELTQRRDCPMCASVRGAGDIAASDAFREGLVTAQDAAAYISVASAGIKPGDTVIDLCAAPGGKSLAAAAIMGNRGKILAFDLHEHKLPLIREAAQRLGATIITGAVGDAVALNPRLLASADVVIADVPCSGLGVIRKKPDARFKSAEAIAEMPMLQAKILRSAAKYVKTGGTLLYSTCTINPDENEGVTGAFLTRHPEFEKRGERTFWPHIDGTDGFYYCGMVRK